MSNKLILIGNGFDLAHGLKTTYKDFLDWYMCNTFQNFCKDKYYNDPLVEVENKYSNMYTDWRSAPKTFEEAIDFISINDQQKLKYNSIFFQRLLSSYSLANWVDVERYYYRFLKTHFSSRNTDSQKVVYELNKAFDFLITKLTEYIKIINTQIPSISALKMSRSRCSLGKVFEEQDSNNQVRFLNFNYTETLLLKHYATKDQIIHIHGRVQDEKNNPIIFGYGDESDPSYQSIEDSGENIYLEHIKSFGYFKTNNYHQLLSYINSNPYQVFIVGHSCGLSDRVLLSEIFENQNCEKIEIFYHLKSNGTDNFKEITQEISRHFKPQNKNLMRKKVIEKNIDNIIPQNSQ